MATVADRIRPINLKFERGNRHIAELGREVADFLSRQPYKVGMKRDAERRPVYYVTSVKMTPETLPLCAGDAIQNLVSALDHLAYQLVGSDTANNWPQPKKIYFPIADSQALYNKDKARKLQGVSAATLAKIDTLKPYKNGNDPLWI